MSYFFLCTLDHLHTVSIYVKVKYYNFAFSEGLCNPKKTKTFGALPPTISKAGLGANRGGAPRGATHISTRKTTRVDFPITSW